ncbi:HK97-gp10 family putative phage morphogenesis protein [Novosphingobium decolorationis]|uniref:HK97 gp10 family phage protein n=1 Tax=Novosphingobium decolorationis TaxID=2698673 RepID=A0ABX8E1J6_9SPHN|nr:HK97-gp10 family putative phage morphogenesis protein [Novosphingobium decolorationis]QVM82997.1 HK97 gp10 family phage protein [Novosphingobium decolorationis]
MAKFKGADAHLKRLKQMREQARKQAGEMVEDLAKQHAEEAKASIVKRETPSRPGKPPREVTGELKDSIRAEKTGPTSARSIADAPHALSLEFGTEEMKGRPFMRPAANTVRKDIREKGKAAVKRTQTD